MAMKAPIPQVPDDPSKLDQMLKDMGEAPGLYRPTNYWANYQRRFLPELQREGLRDFRRRRRSVLSAFGATDRSEKVRLGAVDSGLLGRVQVLRRAADMLVAGVHRALPVELPYGLTPENLRRLAYERADAWGRERGARPIGEYQTSLAGNPEDLFEVDGRPYTMSSIYYYLRYAYVAGEVDLDKMSTLVELGSGSGKQAELLHKLHPNLGIVLFDIPPQLYVCEQYLSTVFPGKVVGYRETRGLERFPSPSELAGKIHIFAAWDFPLLAEADIDVFWNAQSFQEMEPSVVANYLGFINKAARFVYLQEEMEGKERAAAPGDHGVLQATTLEHYKACLPDFDLQDIRPCRLLLSTSTTESDSFWRRPTTPGEEMNPP